MIFIIGVPLGLLIAWVVIEHRKGRRRRWR